MVAANSRKKNVISIYDVAARAKVSVMTVSRVLNSPEKVSEQLRNRVNDSIKNLGYIPNSSAKALASARSQTIGVIIPSVSNSVFSEVLDGIYQGLEQTNFNVQFANTHYADHVEEGLIKLFLQQRPAGLIVTGTGQSKACKTLLSNAECPVVQIMDYTTRPIDMVVGFLHQDAGAAAATHLLQMGYRRLGFLGARMDPRTVKRQQGFENAIRQWPDKIKLSAATTTNLSSVSEGARLFRQLLDKSPNTDAVFCNNDDVALGALFEAQRMGLRVPDQVGIIGFNNLEFTRATTPALSTIETPRKEMGRLAVEMIVSTIKGQRLEKKNIKLPYALMARESTVAKFGDNATNKRKSARQ